jgi:hypothetical protein
MQTLTWETIMTINGKRATDGLRDSAEWLAEVCDDARGAGRASTGFEDSSALKPSLFGWGAVAAAVSAKSVGTLGLACVLRCPFTLASSAISTFSFCSHVAFYEA